MAVAYSSTKSATPATNSTFTSGTWDLSGLSNPVIVIEVALYSQTATVSSISWSLGGTGAEILNTRNFTSFMSVWAIPAPVTGSGTYTVNLSASVAFQINADVFTGADQTTPCPVADAVATQDDIVTSLTVTPTNVTASDGQAGGGSNTEGADTSSFTPNQTYNGGSTSVNELTGYRIGTGSLTSNWVNVAGAQQCLVGVRIVAGGAASLSPPFKKDPFATLLRRRQPQIERTWEKRNRIFVPDYKLRAA